MIVAKFGAAANEDERRALFVHLFDEFVPANIKMQKPFDVEVSSGKTFYDSIFLHFELHRMADFMLDVPIAQIKVGCLTLLCELGSYYQTTNVG